MPLATPDIGVRPFFSRKPGSVFENERVGEEPAGFLISVASLLVVLSPV